MNQSKDKNFVNRKESKQLRKEILDILPIRLRGIFEQFPPEYVESVEEIRLRGERPLCVSMRNRDYYIDDNGVLLSQPASAYQVKKEDIEKAFHLLTDYSVYALEEEIRNGFITIKGGHRVGLSGRVVLNGPSIKTMKEISGLNIRISNQKLGVSDPIMGHLIQGPYQIYHTLIVSPPQCGKTTLLRDIIRNISNGMEVFDFKGLKVGVVDERSEICATYQGIPQNDVGIRTDILDACPKAEGIMMLIRSMSPQVIATDEVGKREDVHAVEEALHAGIKLLTTVHGSSLEEIRKRPYLKNILEMGVFERIILLSNLPKVGTVQSILDGSSQEPIFRYATARGREYSVG
ncbi:stage III sporulation protein AA [Geosporobacter ferrireducens]|uniref:Stage III sporulation protein AA n=1 Tax=Geosporobacter ferrireducens TaxID=1424294 RepID=A0A1D8GBB1_9FIRM|nr:stage III sporulation protein AA [Geosporobacter ferrireducens]AOT68163.1 stage III sporulation protein AA [Geosporobacter ferrireducens]MTI54213.1 stage III sporulation protein AA [Geosporobacter ferrireducens]